MKRFVYLMTGVAFGALLTLSMGAVAQTPPPAEEAEEEETEAAPTPAAQAPPADAEEEEEEAWEVPLPKWGETKIRDWKLADEANFADAVLTANLNDAVFIAFAKLDGSAPCSDSANCKGWFNSLSEAGRRAALTRLANAIANSFASLGFDRSEVEELGFAGLVGKIEENRAFLSIARLQRDVATHDGTLYGIAGITDGGKAIRAKQRLERKVDQAAEKLETIRDEATELHSRAADILTSVNEAGISAAIKNVRETRYTAAKAKYDAKVLQVAAAKEKLDKLETELAGGPVPDSNLVPGGGAANSGSGTIN